MNEDDDMDGAFDEAPTREELHRIRDLSSEALSALDALLLSRCDDEWRPVAAVVGSSLDEFEALQPDLPFVFLPMRLQALVEQDRLEARGPVMAMSGAEIRRPTGA